MSDRKLINLQKKINYSFKDQSLLITALTHRSYSKQNNERFEFLGDSILGITITEYLFKHFTDASEGQLSRMRSSLVKGDVLAQLSLDLDVSSVLLLGPGELKSGGNKRNSILADTLEAIFAAVYLDSTLQQAQQVVLTIYSSTLETLDIQTVHKDPKSQLQEWLQARQLPLPTYQLVETRGKDHEQEFVVECTVINFKQATVGSASSRRKAEQTAAQKMLEEIKK